MTDTITLVITGVLTAGYYNAMEAGFPIFIDNESVDDKIKDALKTLGHSDNFCFEPFGSEADVKNPLVGCRVTLTLTIE